MKKMFLIGALMMSSLSISFGGEGDKIKVVSSDTTSSKVIFDVHSNGNNVVAVDLSGVTSEMASISLIDQKGESIYYHFVDGENEHVEIDLQNVKPGLYYVKLNLDSEIRMKLVVVDNQ